MVVSVELCIEGIGVDREYTIFVISWYKFGIAVSLDLQRILLRFTPVLYPTVIVVILLLLLLFIV